VREACGRSKVNAHSTTRSHSRKVYTSSVSTHELIEQPQRPCLQIKRNS